MSKTEQNNKKLVKGIVLAVILLLAAVLPALLGPKGNAAEGDGFYGTAWSLLPPVVAIALALITKEVYSSLFVGILMGGLLYAGYNFEGTVLHVFQDGITGVLSSTSNVGILVFLVVLGAMVSLMNRAGGSAAFGRWASAHIKTRTGAQLATIVLGVLIFIDDYFNCLTVGSVMRPVTDKHRVSRAKLAYLIDATAAPVCIIAPISSWAAAVASYVEEGNGLTVFIKAIPFNFYAILTLVMMVGMALMKIEFGPMARYEENAEKTGDLFSGRNPYANGAEEEAVNEKGGVIDLILPVAVLIVSCVIGMIYTGGFFSGTSFVDAFSDADVSLSLMLGSVFALVFTILFYCLRRSMSFSQAMGSIPEGFKAMVPAILILTFAWTLNTMTSSLGAGDFVANLVRENAGGFQAFLPAVVFLIACFLSFSTGTSWGTFGILIPITLNVFPLTSPLGVVCVSASMAGAVCGDHCSPISDTTIMASAGAQCDHVDHVSTQLPYAIVAAAVSFAAYLVAGFVPSAFVALPVAVLLMLGTLAVFKVLSKRKAA